MQSIHSAKFLRKRKFMLVLPLITLPFVTIIFWALGGGSANASGGTVKSTPGLNLQLPDANLSDDKADKLSFYNKAVEDSNRLRMEMQNDPYYRNRLDTLPAIPFQQSPQSSLNPSPYHPAGISNPTEARIYERLDALNDAIQPPPAKMTGNENDFPANGQSDLTGDVDRLENMMQLMNEKGADDPEMKQLGTVLDKILDIQHPERVNENTRERSLEKKVQVFSVSPFKTHVPVSYFGSERKADTSRRQSWGFYGDGVHNAAANPAPNAVPAVVQETQIVTTGSTVKLRLLSSVYVNGLLIPAGSFVYGTASLEDERLLIKIPGIRCGDNLLPVSLTVHDIDGLAGVYIPGSISRDVAKQSADQSLQSSELLSLDPSLKAQAAAAGISTVKGLLSKKVKLVKVTLKAGYKVLLKDGNRQDN